MLERTGLSQGCEGLKPDDREKPVAGQKYEDTAVPPGLLPSNRGQQAPTTSHSPANGGSGSTNRHNCPQMLHRYQLSTSPTFE